MSEGLFDDVGPDRQMCINELQRELHVRESVYPRWVERGTIKSDVAAHRILCLTKAIVLLKEGQ
jgi:hypothetical protein